MKKKIKENISLEQKNYLHKLKIENLKIKSLQIGILILALLLWEIFARLKIIDSFIMSCPSRFFSVFLDLYNSGQLWNNIFITSMETLIGFIIGTLLGIIIASLIWWSPFVLKVSDPYLVVLNALPKVALGPIIIVWIGAGMGSIVLMAVLVSVVISIMNILQGFENISKDEILLMRSFGASKYQIFTKLVFPASIPVIMSTLKINVGMSLIGVITGEFLVSSSGIGYLIVYGGQVFKMDLVIAGVIMLSIMASIMYFGVSALEKINLNKRK